MTFSRILAASTVFLAWQDRAVARSLHQMDCEDDTCADIFEKCGGTNMTVSIPCCNPDTSCVVKNYFYAQCLTEERAAKNVMAGWDGTVLEECTEMPEDTLKGPAVTSRRRLQAGSYGDTECDEEVCGDAFEQCAGGYNMSQACCDPSTKCTIKNWYYGQCLTPERAEMNVQNGDWDGRTLGACEYMPTDAPGGPDFWSWEEDEEDMPSRRLSQAMETDCEDDDCVGKFDKCGGTGFNVSLPCCDDGVECIAKNYWYAQCLPLARVEKKVAEQGWDGRVLMCEEMPDDLEPQSSRRLLDVGTTVTSGGYGDAPAPSARESSLVLGSGCETCAPMFGQCGDYGAIVSCCGAGLQCIKKNSFYAQCITPERAARNVGSLGWDGEVLACGQIMG